MIMAGNEFCGEVPFKNVYLTGIVRDKQGRKMSKSLGNSPDPIKLMEQYGADGVRLGMLLCSSAGNDILFDESQVEQGRNFCNKIWNSYRLISGWEVASELPQAKHSALAVEWFSQKLSLTIDTVNDLFDKFRISDALMTLYKFFWDDYCAWYLEIIKPDFGKPMDKVTYDATIAFFDDLLMLLHPIMPFITEELWQNIAQRADGETIMLQQQPKAGKYDMGRIAEFELSTAAVAAIRNIRQSKGISPKEALPLLIKGNLPKEMVCIVERMANINPASFVDEIENRESGAAFMVGTIDFFVPLEGKVNVEEEIEDGGGNRASDEIP